MIKSNRIFSIAKSKNDSKIIDSFIYTKEKYLLILTSIGRIFKFNLSNEYLLPNTKQSQGSVLVKLFPKEKIVSCCKSNLENILYLVSYKGKFLKLKIDKVHNANDAKLGYLNENFNLGDDHFIKIFTDDYLLDRNK